MTSMLQGYQEWHQSKVSVWFPISGLTFAVSRTIYEKFDVKQSTCGDIEISPRSSTVVSPWKLSCDFLLAGTTFYRSN